MDFSLTPAIIWFSLACAVLIAEMCTGTFFLMMVSAGLFCGGLAAYFEANFAVQLLVCVFGGLLSYFCLYRFKKAKAQKKVSENADVHPDIGSVIEVPEWHQVGAGTFIARVSYRGAFWNVRLREGAEPRTGLFKIESVSSDYLVVA